MFARERGDPEVSGWGTLAVLRGYFCGCYSRSMLEQFEEQRQTWAAIREISQNATPPADGNPEGAATK
jgi:hypothetical protein